jgi:hypothetical protein
LLSAELTMTNREKHSYHTYIQYFLNEDILVVCPHCSRQAFVQFSDKFREAAKREIRLVCTHCGHNKTTEEFSPAILFSSKPVPAFGQHILIGAALDPYFHLPLWLATPCCGNILWAYNDAHLAFLKSVVEAGLRERNGIEKSNQSLGSRLPRSITSAKNRETVLKAIESLQHRSG